MNRTQHDEPESDWLKRLLQPELLYSSRVMLVVSRKLNRLSMLYMTITRTYERENKFQRTSKRHSWQTLACNKGIEQQEQQTCAERHAKRWGVRPKALNSRTLCCVGFVFWVENNERAWGLLANKWNLQYKEHRTT